MTRTRYPALHIAAVSAIGTLAVAVCAAQAAAGPRTGGSTSQPLYPGFPSAVVTHRAHVTQVPQLQVHPQRLQAVPVFTAPNWMPYAPSVFGGGFMNGFLPNQCGGQQAPMTLGELAPGGDTGFAPVSHSLIDPASAGDPSWNDSLTGSGTYDMPQAPFQGPMGLTGGTQSLGLPAHCAPGSSFDFTDMQLGL